MSSNFEDLNWKVKVGKLRISMPFFFNVGIATEVSNKQLIKWNVHRKTKRSFGSGLSLLLITLCEGNDKEHFYEKRCGKVFIEQMLFPISETWSEDIQNCSKGMRKNYEKTFNWCHDISICSLENQDFFSNQSFLKFCIAKLFGFCFLYNIFKDFFEIYSKVPEAIRKKIVVASEKFEHVLSNIK